MVNNPKLMFFVIVLLSSFSTCTAEDFWIRTGFEDETREVICAFKDSIFINSGSYSFLSDDKGITWDTLFTKEYPYYIDNASGYLYVGGSLMVSRIHRDSIYFKELFDYSGQGLNGIYKFNSSFYLPTAYQIIRFNEEWTQYESVLGYNSSASEELTCMAIDSVGTLYAGSTDFMNIDAPGGVYKSYDNGETWSYPDLPNHFVRAIAVDSEGRIFVGTCGHYYDGTGLILRSEDNGNTWEVVLGGTYVLSMAINSKDEIFVGLDEDYAGYPCVLKSQDHGTTWVSLEEGYPGGDVFDIAISRDGYVYLATRTGVYRSINSTTGIEEGESGLANNFELFQNYPNPFNNETVINFNLNKSYHVQLSIFNYKGELIKDIKNQKMSKGYHSVNLNAGNLGSGVYYYSLKVDNKTVSTKKMLYIR